MVYLCGRPLPDRGRCTLGRETAIQRMVWGEDGWLRTADGTASRRSKRGAAGAGTPSAAGRRGRTSTAPQLPIDFQWLRSPWPDELFSLTERPGFLRLYGRETVGSVFNRRSSHAGSRPTATAPRRRRVRAAALPADGRADLLLQRREVPLPVHLDRRCGGQAPAGDVSAARPAASGRVLAAYPMPSGPARRTARRSRLRPAAVRVPGGRRRVGSGLPQQFDASILSDEATTPGQPNFTGAFVGMACQDMSGATLPGGFRLVRVRRAALQVESVRAGRRVSPPFSGTTGARTP